MVFTTSPPNSRRRFIQTGSNGQRCRRQHSKRRTLLPSLYLYIGYRCNRATLSGTTAVSAVSGVATFSGLSINKSSAVTILLTATDGTLNATSSPFTISVGAASQLVFTQQPSMVRLVLPLARSRGDCRRCWRDVVTTFGSSIALTLQPVPVPVERH